MEKRISFFQFQSVKNVAKAIDPKLRERATLQKKAIALKEEIEAKQAKLQQEIDEKTAKLKAEFDNCETQINLLEAGIVQTLGFHVADLVKKVIEPTGKTDAKTGKPLTVTKYLPTDIVSYDETAKEYVITTPEEGETVVPPTTEDTAGSDFDKDSESFRQRDEQGNEDTGDDAEVQDEPDGTGEMADAKSERKDEMPWD